MGKGNSTVTRVKERPGFQRVRERGSSAKNGRHEVRGEESETKEVILAAAVSPRARGPGIAHRSSSSRKIACLQFPRRHYVIERPGIFDPNAPRHPRRFEEHAASCQFLHTDPMTDPNCLILTAFSRLAEDHLPRNPLL